MNLFPEYDKMGRMEVHVYDCIENERGNFFHEGSG